MGEPVSGRLVVGVAVVRKGRLLVARRVAPAALARRWELPGGKVRPGEPPETAAVREVREELGCEVAVTGWVAGEEPVRAGLWLRVALARLVSGEPVPSEHDMIRWLAPEQLTAVAWLEPDLPFLPRLRDVLLGRAPSPDVIPPGSHSDHFV